MSGSAALSAARKRRASTAQPMAGNGQNPQTMYNNRVPPPQSVVPGVSFSNEPPKFIQPYPQHAPGNGFPPQPMNIYENIELIKQQLIERTKLIQTQGSTLPPERLNMLHKQNEIQTQILKQKIEIAKQMELTNPPANVYDQRGPISMSSSTEPEFIYERGVPRKNPNYKTAVQNGSVQRSMGSSNDITIQVKPFVSMISDTGVIPPPIVILKSHDAKLEEHNQILTEMAAQLSDMQSKVKSSLTNTSNEKASKITSTESSNKINHLHREEDVDEVADEDAEEEEELLMDVVMNDLTNSREFVEGIVNKIVNETNLSEVIMKIEPLVKENQELRSLIHSQQQMMNEMNTMLLRLMNQNNMIKQPVFQDNGLDSDGLYEPEMTEIVLSRPVQEEQQPVKSSENDVKPESETTIPESSDNSEAVIENQPTVDAPHAEDEEIRTVDPNDQDSGPHFPTDPVSLIINEIQ
jgi:hypothetical protein